MASAPEIVDDGLDESELEGYIENNPVGALQARQRANEGMTDEEVAQQGYVDNPMRPVPEQTEFQSNIQKGVDAAENLTGILKNSVLPQERSMLKDVLPHLRNYDLNKDEWQSEGMASFFAQALAATQDTPEGKLKVLSKHLFPDEPEAYRRFSMVDGIPVYVDDGGNYWAAARGDVIGTARELGADMVGKLPTIAGDVIGAAATGARFGSPGTILGGATGAMLGEYGRQKLGELVTGEDVDPLEIAKEGGMSGAGGGLGHLAVKWLERAAPGGWSKSLNAMKPIQEEEMRSLGEISSRLGGGQQLSTNEQYLFDRINNKLAEGERLSGDEVQLFKELQAKQDYSGLTPAELTNSRSLKGQQRFAGNVGRAGDIMDEFVNERAINNQNVWDNFTLKFGVDDLDEAGEALFLGSSKVIDEVTAQRAKKASPLYKRAFNNNWRAPNATKWRSKQKWLMDRIPDYIKDEAQAIYNIRYGKNLENIEDTLVGWHYMKLAIDDRIQMGFMDNLGATKRYGFIDLKDDMLKVMDEMSPTYAKARGIYADETPGVMKVREGILGRIFTEGEKGGDAYKATNMLLSASSQKNPEKVRFAMEKLRKSDPEAADKVLGAFLQVKMIEAGKVVGDAWAAPKVSRMLWKDTLQRSNLKAAMTDEQFAEFSDIMVFFDAQGRAPMGGSATAWNEFEKDVASRRGWKGRLAQLGDFISIDVVQNTLGWLREGAIEDHAERIAMAITSPDGIRQLRRLDKIKNSQKRRIHKWAYIAGQVGHGVESEPEDLTNWGPMP